MIVTLMLVSIFGLAMGSFLNVVISRYPVMLLRSWQAECQHLLELTEESEEQKKVFNLARPRSRCPHCQQTLTVWQNIPLISFLILHGRCGFCQKRISFQYPLVELLTTLMMVVIFLTFGWHINTLLLWIMTWGLIALAFIDWQKQILPDNICLSLLWLGLLANIGELFVPLSDAVIGAAAGYLLLWVVARLFKILRKKEGMGHGDFKLLAMFGAWLGLQPTLYILLLAVVLSLIFNLILLLNKKINYNQPLPFGPWLAVSGWLIIIVNPILNNFK